MVQKHPETGKPAFVHSNTPKMNAGHLVDEGDLVDWGTGKHLRLWGDEERAMDVFGIDLEARIWKVLRDTGCQLEGTVREWRDRKDLCTRLKVHWNKVFGGVVTQGWTKGLDEDEDEDDDDD